MNINTKHSCINRFRFIVINSITIVITINFYNFISLTKSIIFTTMLIYFISTTILTRSKNSSTFTITRSLHNFKSRFSSNSINLFLPSGISIINYYKTIIILISNFITLITTNTYNIKIIITFVKINITFFLKNSFKITNFTFCIQLSFHKSNKLF